MTPLPRGWTAKRLAEVCRAPAKVDPASTGRETIRYVDIGSVDGATHRLTDVGTVRAMEAPSRARQMIKPGDTVFSTVRPYLEKIAYITPDLDGEFASTGFCVLRPGPELLPRYLFHFATSRQLLEQVLPHQRGVSYPAVLNKDVLGSTIPLPPLEEQRRIVDIVEDHLSRLDAAQTAMESAGLRQSVLRSALLERLVRTTDPVARLGDVASASGYGTSAKCVEGGPGPSVVRIPNLRYGRVDLTDEKRVEDPDFDVSELMLQSGDLLIVRTNGSRDLIGRSAVVQQGVNAAFASYLIRFRLDHDRVLPQWVHAMLETPSMRRRLEAMAASSAGQYNLGLTKLATLPIPLPSSTEEQVRRLDGLEEALDGLEVLSATIGVARRRLVRLRRALLGAAFSGRLTGAESDTDRVEALAGV